MKIAYTMAPGRGDTDLLLQGLVQTLEGKGLRAAGTIQINTERPDAGPCDMDVKVLPDGPILRISQSLGRNSRGCRLDPASLESAVGLVESRMTEGVDVLIINKFGKHEAEGRGFRPVIAEALAMGIPVLVGVNELNLAAFEAFVDGLAEGLAPEPKRLADWVLAAIAAPCSAG